MSQANTAVQIEDDTIVAIPEDLIALGHDADGLPKTVSTEKPVEKRERRTPTIAELEAMRRDRDAKQAEAEQRTREAAAAKAEAEQERARAHQSDTHAHTNYNYAIRAHYDNVSGQLGSVNAAIVDRKAMADTAQRELATAEAELGVATDAADRQRLAERKAAATKAISRAEAELVQLEGAKPQLESAARQAYDAAVAASQAPAPVAPEKKTEPEKPAQFTADQWIDQATQHVGSEGADWLREHRDVVTDTAKNNQLLAFSSYYATKHGQSALKSEEFRKALDQEFGFVEEADPEEVVVEEPKAKPVAKPAAKTTPAAPVSRGGSLFSSRNPNASQVKLPPKLAAFVKASGLDLTQYALGAVADIKAGKLPANFLDPDYPH